MIVIYEQIVNSKKNIDFNHKIGYMTLYCSKYKNQRPPEGDL